MTFKTATDFRKSLEARLKSYSMQTGQDLQRIRRKEAFAQVFYVGSNDFVLKGGMRWSSVLFKSEQQKILTCLHREENPDIAIEELNQRFSYL